MKLIGHIIIPNVYSLYPDTMQIYYKQSIFTVTLCEDTCMTNCLLLSTAELCCYNLLWVANFQFFHLQLFLVSYERTERMKNIYFVVCKTGTPTTGVQQLPVANAGLSHPTAPVQLHNHEKKGLLSAMVHLMPRYQYESENLYRMSVIN